MDDMSGSQGCTRLRLLDFPDNSHMKMVRLSTLYTGRLYPLEDILGTQFC